MYRSLVFAALLTFASTCLAQFSYAPLDVPGARVTVARGINNSGEVVGFYQTTSCDNYDLNVPSCPTQGFKLVHNQYVKLMVPKSTATAVTGVNDLGDLVGFYTKADGTHHGFIWYHQNVIQTIDLQGTPYKTVPMGINNAGTVVGGLWTIGAAGTFSDSGWIWTNGKFNIKNSGESIHRPCCHSVNGISNRGMIVGQVHDGDGWQTWLNTASDKEATSGEIGDTLGTGLNIYGDATGNKTGGKAWFGRNVESGRGKGATEGTFRFVLLNYPNARSTQSFGMNDSRYLVGSYIDAAGKRHGFIAQPEF